MFQEQLLAELERIQLELDQLRGRPGSSYSRSDAMNMSGILLNQIFKKKKKRRKKTVSQEMLNVEAQIFVNSRSENELFTMNLEAVVLDDKYASVYLYA